MNRLWLTCWLMIAALLLQGGGVVSSLHKLRHHTGDSPAVSGCSHDSVHSSHERGDPEPTPEPDNDDDCSICLGLAGLHLIPIAEAPRVVPTPIFESVRLGKSISAIIRVDLGDHPARAPPVC